MSAPSATLALFLPRGPPAGPRRRGDAARSCEREDLTHDGPVPRGHRRRGLAAALLDEVVTLAVRARAERLLLEVREDNQPALAFYAGYGFVEVDRRRRYYRDGAAAVVLVRPLGRVCGSSTMGS